MNKDECCNILNLKRDEIFRALDEKVKLMGNSFTNNEGEDPRAVIQQSQRFEGDEIDDPALLTSKLVADIKSNPIKEISSIINSYCTNYVHDQIEYNETLRERNGSRVRARRLSENQLNELADNSKSKEKKTWNISTKTHKHCCVKKDFEHTDKIKTHFQSSKQVVNQVKTELKKNGEPSQRNGYSGKTYSNLQARPIEETLYQNSFKAYLSSKNFKKCDEKNENVETKPMKSIKKGDLDLSYDLNSKPKTTSIIKSIRNNSANPRGKNDVIELEERMNNNIMDFHHEEAELLYQIFREIGPNQNQLIKKTDLVNYLKLNKTLSEIYDIDLDHIHEILKTISGSDEAYLDFGEFVAFFKIPKSDINYEYEEDIQKNEFLNYREGSFGNNMKNRNLISQEELRELKKIFSCLDTNANFKVDRFKFINELRRELEHILRNPAIYIGIIDKFLPLGKILNQIEHDAFSPEEEGVKHLISWEKFKSYFTNYRFESKTNRHEYWILRASIFNEDDKNKCDGQEQLVIKEEIYEKLYCCFKKILNPIEGHVETRLLLDIIRSHPEYSVFSKSIGRQREEFFVTKSDDVEYVLAQVEREADFFIDWDDFVDFFRRKGIPMGLMSKVEKKELKAQLNISTDLSKERVIEQFYKSSLRIEPGAINEDNLKSKLFQRVFEEDQDEIDMCYEKEYRNDTHTLHKVMNEEMDKIYGASQYGATNKSSGSSFNITIPQPFNFREKAGKTIMQKRLEEDLMKKEYEKQLHESFKFKAKPVPAHVKDINLWEKISGYDKNRRSQAYQSKAQQLDEYFFKPFEFLIRESNKPKKQPKKESPYRYVASPVPPICTVEIMGRLKEENEKSRQERRLKWNEISMALSKLPQRMEDWYTNMKNKMRSIRKGEAYQPIESQYSFKPEIHHSMPDFELLHKKNEDDLQIRKMESNIRKTAVMPFNFSQNRKMTRRSHMDEENIYKKTVLAPNSNPIKYKEILKEKLDQPKSTTKWEAHVERRRLEREQKDLVYLRNIEEEQRRLQRQSDFSKIVRQSQALKNDPIRAVIDLIRRENADIIKDEMKKNEIEYNKKRKEIFDKVYSNRPLILEQQAQQNLQESRFRELLRLFSEHPEMQERIIEEIDNFRESITNQEQQEIAEINNEEEEDR